MIPPNINDNNGPQEDIKSEKKSQIPEQTSQFEKIVIGLKETLTEGKPLPLDTKKILKKIIEDGN